MFIFKERFEHLLAAFSDNYDPIVLTILRKIGGKLFSDYPENFFFNGENLATSEGLYDVFPYHGRLSPA